MKKHLIIPGALTLLIMLAGCGGGGGGINLGTLTNPVFATADMVDAANAACVDSRIAQVNTVTVNSIVSGADYILSSVAGVEFEVSDASDTATAAQVAEGFARCINHDATSTTNITYSNCASDAPGVTAAYSSGNTFTITSDAPGYPFTFSESDVNLSYAVTTPNDVGCSGNLQTGSGDSTAINAFFGEIGFPHIEDLLLCSSGSVPDGYAAADCEKDYITDSLPGVGSTKRISISASTTTFCNGTDATDGVIKSDISVSFAIDHAGDPVPLATEPLDIKLTTNASGCAIAGDLGILPDGSVATTIVLDGSHQEEVHSTDTPLAATDPRTDRQTASIGITTDLNGSGAGTTAFWSDSLNIDVSAEDDGSTTTYNGGLCFGGKVNFGSNPSSSSDDGTNCQASGDLWIPADSL